MGGIARREGRRKRGFGHQQEGCCSSSGLGWLKIQEPCSGSHLCRSSVPSSAGCGDSPMSSSLGVLVVSASQGINLSSFLFLQFSSFFSFIPLALPEVCYKVPIQRSPSFEIPSSLSISLTLPSLIRSSECRFLLLFRWPHIYPPHHTHTFIYLRLLESLLLLLHYHKFWELHCHSGFKLVSWIERK